MKPTGAAKEATGEPTPRPWRAVALLPDGLEHHIIAGEFRDGSAIASADNPNGLVAYADMPVNAQLIVTAVNERERLRTVWQKHHKEAEDYGFRNCACDYCAVLNEAAREASDVTKN